ncbi:4-carboxy-2-hydroxymuconate-6-semialdehyde dehydrogenase [Antarctobacter heliothermus]|uniref:4-carboxy-2-hydroxymuconate-6-semialdehyde dehydrogenase n=1 Tax=Antarctobacter heliothermus TaxID=74033 RepID=A0A222E5A2_9RHOB|nr:Gfo/Idh/MocA family oxidoreductase [Antarctobacter heliothermus]ASP21168.1 4-carboxy-2-hydroxymuconate-6-semialdehyde dehydrogenase [Antarctobacter heliothermus]
MTFNDRANDTRPLRVACLGAGYFSRFHYDGWRRIAGVDLVGACDHDIAKARDTGAPAFDDLANMLSETTPDLLDVIVPPPAQAQAIRTALAAGVRALICQKPFCTSPAEALAITQEAETAGALLVIHENFRFQPWYRVMKARLDAGEIGTVQQITFRLRPGDGQGPDAYLDRQPYFQQMPRFLVHETAVHWIDTFRYLLGAPSAVYADLRQVNPVIAGEDAGYILFDHPGGARALFDGNRLLDHAATNTRCTMGEALAEGTTGTLTLTGDGALHLRRFGALEAQTILPPDTSDTFGGDCVFALQSHVVSCLRNGDMPENTARDYLPVISIENAVYTSAAEGRKLELDPRASPNEG